MAALSKRSSRARAKGLSDARSDLSDAKPDLSDDARGLWQRTKGGAQNSSRDAAAKKL
jgi:hypothetical protein